MLLFLPCPTHYGLLSPWLCVVPPNLKRAGQPAVPRHLAHLQRNIFVASAILTGLQLLTVLKCETH